MKRTITMLIVCLLILGVFPLTAFAQSALQEVQAKVEALPMLSSVETVESEAYTKALASAKEAVYGLAYLSEDEMEQVAGYQKAFQLYIDLILMEAAELLPQTPTNAENYLEQTVALERVNQIIFEGEPLFLLAEYTYDTVNENFFPPETTTGFVSLYHVQKQYHQACEVRVNYLNGLNATDWLAMNHQELEYALQRFPQTFTTENVLTYAPEFGMLIQDVEDWEGRFFYSYQTCTACGKRYDQLREDFELAMGINANYFLDQVELEILELCQNSKASSYSQLQLQLIERQEYDRLAVRIEMLAYINGSRVYIDIDNYELFEAYEQVFWPAAYVYGDINGDGLVNATDALLILRVAVGKQKVNRERFTVGDLDADGAMNAKDALLVLQYTVEKIQWFPVEMQLYGILV